MTLSMSAPAGVKRRTGEFGDSARNVHELAQSLSARVGKGVDPPGAVGTGGMAELHRLGVGEAHHRRRVESHADREALGELLVRGLGGQHRRRRVMRRHTRRVATRLHEVRLQLGRIDAAEFRVRLDPSAARP